MIQGEPINLAQVQQATLAQWIAMKVMVAEHSRGDDVIATEVERSAFRSSRTIPRGFQIWLGRCGLDRWRSGLFRSAATYSLPYQIIDRTRKNTGTVTFGIGDLLVFVLNTSVRHLFQYSAQMLAKMHPLWPPKDSELAWPLTAPLSIQDADQLANSLNSLSRQPGVVWRPYPSPLILPPTVRLP
jgi:hypothetical protein